jgi:hypothetical protein
VVVKCHMKSWGALNFRNLFLRNISDHAFLRKKYKLVRSLCPLCFRVHDLKQQYGGCMSSVLRCRLDDDNQWTAEARYVLFCMEIDHKYR